MTCTCGSEMSLTVKRDKVTGKYSGIASCSACHFELDIQADTCLEVIDSVETTVKERRLDLYQRRITEDGFSDTPKESGLNA